MSDFGRDNPREMPAHLFSGSLRVDYGSAVRADAERQNRSICPRHWYVDIIFPCGRCGREFTFTAAEQRLWYEEHGFWIDSLPKRCLVCRRQLRDLKAARREYDGSVEKALLLDNTELKERLVRIIDQLYELGRELPPRINENRKRLAQQLSRTRQDGGQ